MKIFCGEVRFLGDLMDSAAVGGGVLAHDMMSF